MEYELDGFTFSLSEGSTVIYVFKGDAYVTNHFCKTEKDAKKLFEEIKTKKRVLIKGDNEYAIQKNEDYKRDKVKINKVIVKCKTEDCSMSKDGFCTAKEISMEYELAGPEATYGYMKCEPRDAKRDSK